MQNKNKTNYKLKVLKKLMEASSGLTIKELSEKSKIHRNTVSKYLGILYLANLSVK